MSRSWYLRLVPDAAASQPAQEASLEAWLAAFVAQGARSGGEVTKDTFAAGTPLM